MLCVDHLLCIKKGNSFIEWNEVNMPMSACIHCEVSDDKQLVALTFSAGYVFVIRIVYDKQDNPCGFRFMNRLICMHPRVTRIDYNQMICVTCCLENVVIWSISSGFVTGFIDLANVSCLVCVSCLSRLYLCQGSTLFEYTVNGNLTRKCELGSNVTCLGICGNGFGFTDRVIVAVNSDGKMRLIGVSLDGEFKVLASKRVGKKPIQGIRCSENSYLIHVHETY